MRRFAQTTILLILTAVGAYAQTQGRTAHPVYDGAWWASLYREETSGFVNGYEDCTISDAKAHSTTSVWTDEDYQKAIDDYLRAHPGQKRRSVADILKEIDQTGKPRPLRKGGEHWTEPHGFYDGLWWRGGSPLKNIGYVEGYLACYSTELSAPLATYSRAPREYVELIDHYIDSHVKADDEKLAYILRRFADPPK